MKLVLLLALCLGLFYEAAANHHACCFSSGSCRSLGTIACHIAQGEYVGNERPDGCDALEHLCPGACCFPDRCEWKFENECSGLYRGNGTSCRSDCDGVCCHEHVCSEKQEFECEEGKFHAVGTHCLPEDVCPKNDPIVMSSLIFAALFFVFALLLLFFVCWRNRKK